MNWRVLCVSAALFFSFVSLSFAEDSTPAPIMEYLFNETGTVANNTGSASLPDLQLRDKNSNPFDLHTPDGEGFSGEAGDRAYNPRLDPLDSGRATQVFDDNDIDALKQFTVSLSYNSETLETQGSSFYHNWVNGKAGMRLQGNLDGTFSLFINEEEIISSVDYMDVGAWVTVIVVYDGSAMEVKFYKCFNGVLTLISTHRTNESCVLDEKVPFSIGSSVRCKMDNVRLYRAALTEDQIKENLCFSQEAPTPTPGVTPPPQPPAPEPEEDKLFVTGTNPKNKQENVLVDLEIEIKFNQNIRSEEEFGGMDTKHFTLKEIARDNLGNVIFYGPDISGSYKVEENILNFTPFGGLEYGLEYMGFVKESIRAANAGGTACIPYTFTFTTESFIPPTPIPTAEPTPSAEPSPTPSVEPSPSVTPPPPPPPPPTPIPTITVTPSPIPSPNLTPTPSAKGMIYGTVFSIHDGETLEGVKVVLIKKGDDIKRKYVTEENGQYKFDELPLGRYKVVFSKSEWITIKRRVRLTTKEPVKEVSITLDP